MSTEIAITGALAIQPNQKTWDDSQLAALRQLGVADATDGDLAVYLNYCQQTGMSPFAKQIYMIGRREKRGDTWIVKQTIQMGIDGFRIIAQRSQEYQGQEDAQWCGPDGVWKDVWTDTVNPPFAARVGVNRKGFKKPLYAVALWSSYAVYYNDVLSPMWKKHGPGQLAKCAEALAVRKAFPMDLSGIYEPTEMESIDAMESQSASEDSQDPKPNMTKSEPVQEVEVASWTDDEINTASQLIDNVEEFKTSAELKAWFLSEAVVPYHEVPVNQAGLTINGAAYARNLVLVEQETKNG